MRIVLPSLVVLAAFTAVAAPVQVTHSGYLLGATDAPLEGAAVPLAFSVWSDAALTDAGHQVWPVPPAGPATCSVAVQAGYYAVTLGDGTCGSGLDGALLPAGAPRWLEISVNGTRLVPRTALGVVPVAADAAHLGGLSVADLDARYVRVQASPTDPAQAGHLRLSGQVLAQQFVGSGAGLTGVPASSLTGTITDTQLASSGDLLKLSGAQVVPGTKTFTNAQGTFSGTFSGTFLGTASGVLVIPRDATQPYACDAGHSGAIWFDTSAGVLKICNGTSSTWETVGAAAGSRPARLDATPLELDFGTVQVAGVRRSVTLRNDGDVALTSLVATPPAGWTNAGAQCPATLAAGAGCTQTFEFSASGATGARSGNATLTSSANTATVALTGTYLPLDGGSNLTAGTSCAQIHASYPAFTSTTYYLDPDGVGVGSPAFRAWCDMTAANDGGGWMLVASSSSSDATFAGGTGRNSPSYYLTATGWNGNPSPTADYVIGPDFSRFSFTEARLRSTLSNGYVLDAKWPVTSRDAIVARASATFLSGSNVTDYACGNFNWLVLDGVYADFKANNAFDANSNQSTVGAAAVVAANGDPVSGTYWGHGTSEGSFEGFYSNKSGACNAYDAQTYTTWIR